MVVPAGLLYARGQIKLGVMTMGTFATFIYALIRAYEPVKGMGGVYQQFEQTHGGTTQVFEFLELQEEIEEHPGARVLPPFSREVRIRQRQLRLRPGVADPARRRLARARRRSGGHRGLERRGQDHAGEPAAAIPRRDRRALCASTASTCATPRCARCANRSPS